MPTVREFFVTEARECLKRLDTVLARADEAAVDADTLHREARSLRGSAQMARATAAVQLAAVLETAALMVAQGELPWTPALAVEARRTVQELRRVVEAGDEARPAETVRTLVAAWRERGVSTRFAPVEEAARDVAGAPPDAGGANPAFLKYAAREAAGVATTIEGAVPVLTRAPRNREPLKAILRRQRALLGAAALETVPALAEALDAVDQVTRLVARRKASVEGEWLAFYRTAADTLRDVARRLEEAGDVRAVPGALERLRTLRDGLAERYAPNDPAEPEAAGAPRPGPATLSEEDRRLFRGEAAAILDRVDRMVDALAGTAAGEGRVQRQEIERAVTAFRDNARAFGFDDAARRAEAGLARVRRGDAPVLRRLADGLRRAVGLESAEKDTPVVPIESLCYRGPSALRRALELRDRLEAAVGDGADAREVVDEVFDLIRLGLEDDGAA